MISILFLTAVAASIPVTATAPATSASATRWSANADFLAKNYPPESLKRGEQGKVGFQLGFGADGTISSCSITQSSGFAKLDEGTCEMLVKSARIDPARNADGRRVPSLRSGYVEWKLPANVAKLAQSGGTLATETDPLVCKRSSVPGSIIKKVKRCMTRSEWKAHDRLVQDEIFRAQTGNTCSDHGC